MNAKKTSIPEREKLRDAIAAAKSNEIMLRDADSALIRAESLIARTEGELDGFDAAAQAFRGAKPTHRLSH